MRAGIGAATFRKPRKSGCNVAAGAALNHDCICRILVSISVSSFGTFEFSSFVPCTAHLVYPLIRESVDRGCSVVSLCSYLKKNFLRRNCLIRDTSGLIMSGERLRSSYMRVASYSILVVFSSHQQRLIFIRILREYADVRFAVVRIKLT